MIIVIRGQHAGQGAEHLVAIQLHGVAAVDKQRWLHVVAGGGSFQRLTTANQFRTVGLADLDVTQVLLQLGVVHRRSDVYALFQGVTDDQVVHGPLHGFHELVVDATGHYDARRSRTFLAGTAERAVDGTGDRSIEIRVIQHHQGILAAHLHLHLGQVRRAGLRDASPRGQ